MFVIPMAVMAELAPSGLLTFAVKLTLQLLPPDTIVQEEGLGVRVPDITPPLPTAQLVPFQEVPDVQTAVPGLESSNVLLL